LTRYSVLFHDFFVSFGLCDDNYTLPCSASHFVSLCRQANNFLHSYVFHFLLTFSDLPKNQLNMLNICSSWFKKIYL